MTITSEKIKKMYSGVSARHYDLPISHFFGNYKRIAIEESFLKMGDSVIVFCCGTGLDFSPIVKRVGEEGRIVGLDFSPTMLKQAEQKIRKKRWKNISLREVDVTEVGSSYQNQFDVGICTLGLSIIPDYQSAYTNLLSSVKPGGSIIIGDAQLATGPLSFFNPLTIFLARRYGGSNKGHKNSHHIRLMMERDLKDRKSGEFFMNSYFYCTGIKK